MANTKALPTPVSAGQKLHAAVINQIDDGQYAALVRNGDSPLLTNSSISLGNFNLGISTGGGTGKLRLDPSCTEITGAAWPSANARQEPNYVPPADASYLPGKFEFGAGNWRQLANGEGITFFVTLPLQQQVTGVWVPMVKANGGTFPTIKPVVYFGYLDLANGASDDGVVLLGPVTDPSANSAAYQTRHRTGGDLSTPHTIAGNRAYFVSVLGDDTSTTDTNGLRVYKPVFDLMMVKLRPV